MVSTLGQHTLLSLVVATLGTAHTNIYWQHWRLHQLLYIVGTACIVHHLSTCYDIIISFSFKIYIYHS